MYLKGPFYAIHLSPIVTFAVKVVKVFPQQHNSLHPTVLGVFVCSIACDLTKFHHRKHTLLHRHSGPQVVKAIESRRSHFLDP